MLTIVNNIASKYVYCKVVYSACLIKIVKKKVLRDLKSCEPVTGSAAGECLKHLQSILVDICGKSFLKVIR